LAARALTSPPVTIESNVAAITIFFISILNIIAFITELAKYSAG